MLGLSAAGIGAHEGNVGQVFAGLPAAYLVSTGLTEWANPYIPVVRRPRVLPHAVRFRIEPALPR